MKEVYQSQAITWLIVADSEWPRMTIASDLASDVFILLLPH